MSKLNRDVVTGHLGYVVYGGVAGERLPIGVVSDSFECSAVSSSMPTSVKKMLVPIEDKRFYQHHGIDPKGVIRAAFQNFRNLRIVEGGSSITQQLARNLLNDNRRSFSRKIREAVKAVRLEMRYSKDEILKLYFDNAYFGKNLRGFRSAGLHYFGKEIEDLSQLELLHLIAILRGPNYYIPKPEETRLRVASICKRLKVQNVLLDQTTDFSDVAAPKFGNHNLQVIRDRVVPYVKTEVDHHTLTVNSSISPAIQDFCRQWISRTKYPASVVIVGDSGVQGFASSYGSEFPFVAKSNVGSTLKPFLYCHLRKSGVGKSDFFKAYSNDNGWDVREHQYIRSRLTLEECLFYSNNNGFINAVHTIGMDGALHFLGAILRKTEAEMTPSSVLGATKTGISLFELASAYFGFFGSSSLTPEKIECADILGRVFEEKFKFRVDNVFLKTGTTNKNKERYCVIQTPKETLAFLRNENLENDATKEGSFIGQVKTGLLAFLKLKRAGSYTWSI